MEMDEALIEVSDLDWFGLLSNGAVAHFATAGRAHLPDSVRASVENYELAFDYFSSLSCFTEYFVVENLPALSGGRGRKRYISPFAEMASRGLYSYDANEDGGYKLIAVPVVALDLVSPDIISVIPFFKVGPVKNIFPSDLL